MNWQTTTEEQCEELAQFVNSAYRGENSKKGWTTEAELLTGQRTDAASLREIIRNPRETLLSFREDGRLVGSVHLSLDGKDRAFLGMLTVDPHTQGKGLGRQIMLQAEKYVQMNWRKTEIFLAVISVRTELINYYVRRGYVQTGETMDFPMDNPKYGIPIRRDFNLIVLRKFFLRPHENRH